MDRPDRPELPRAQRNGIALLLLMALPACSQSSGHTAASISRGTFGQSFDVTVSRPTGGLELEHCRRQGHWRGSGFSSASGWLLA